MPLPQSVNGDESFAVVTPLRMLYDRTIFPSFYTQYPLLVSYLNLLLFIPIVLFKLVLAGFSFDSIKSDFIANPYEYYLAGRLISILMSVGTVVFVYQICRLFFKKNRWAIVIPSILLAFSLLSVQMSIQNRMWVPTAFLIAWGIYLYFAAITRKDKDSFRNSLILFAFATGTNYVAFLFMAFYFLWGYFKFYKKVTFKNLNDVLLWPAMVSIFFILGTYHELLRYTQIFHKESLSSNALDLWFGIKTVFNYDPAVLCLGLLGLLQMFFKKWKHRYELILPALLYMTFVILFKHYEDRQVLPLYVFLLIGVGYAINTLLSMNFAGSLKKIIFLVIFFLVSWQCLYVLRFDWVVLKEDTRVSLNRWLTQYVPAQTGIVVYPKVYTPVPDKNMVSRIMKTVKPADLQFKLKLLNSLSTKYYPRHSFYLWDLSGFWTNQKDFDPSRIKPSIFKEDGYKYFIFCYYKNQEKKMFDPALFRYPKVWSTYASVHATEIPYNVMNNMIPIQTLFSVNRAGPNIEVYKIN